MGHTPGMVHPPPPSTRPPLFTSSFLALCLVALFGFANIAMFYGFHVYTVRLGLDPDWRGPLLVLEPLVALILRPLLAARLTSRNATAAAVAGLAIVALALLSYPLAREPWPLALVRLVHGLGFVVLVSAATALLAGILPPERSGQGFGIFTVATLLPFALVPPLCEALLRVLGDEALVYAWAAALCPLAALFLLPVGRRMARLAPREHAEPGRSRILAALRLPGVGLLLLAALFAYCAVPTVTFFVKDLALNLGLADPGLVFSVSMGATIAVRLFSGPLFDRLPKLPLLCLGLAGMGLSLALFGTAENGGQLLALAGCFGLSLGLVMPLLNAALFLATPPHLRGLALNLFLFTTDAGTVLGPLLGGALLARGLTLGEIYRLCGGLAAGALVWVLLAARRKGTA